MLDLNVQPMERRPQTPRPQNVGLPHTTHGTSTLNCLTPTSSPWNEDPKPSDSHVQPMERRPQTIRLSCCRWENGSMRIPPMETSFGHWNMLLLSQVENPIIGRIFAGNPNIRLFRCLPNRDVISSLNLPNSHDQNGGTYVRIGGLLKEK